MNDQQIDRLLSKRGISLRRAPEIREFARLPEEEQLVVLYSDLLDRRPFLPHVVTGLATFASNAALIAYVVMGGPTPFDLQP